MLYFGIPVKSRFVSQDWHQVGRLLSRTLASVANQVGGSFRAIIAHHEFPEECKTHDHRFEFLEVQFPSPRDRGGMMVDKNRKRELIAYRVRQYGGGYLMYLDADDLVSSRLAQFVAEDRSNYGYVINKGYELDEHSNSLRWAPSFDLLCGSSA